MFPQLASVDDLETLLRNLHIQERPSNSVQLRHLFDNLNAFGARSAGLRDDVVLFGINHIIRENAKEAEALRNLEARVAEEEGRKTQPIRGREKQNERLTEEKGREVEAMRRREERNERLFQKRLDEAIHREEAAMLERERSEEEEKHIRQRLKGSWSASRNEIKEYQNLYKTLKSFRCDLCERYFHKDVKRNVNRVRRLCEVCQGNSNKKLWRIGTMNPGPQPPELSDLTCQEEMAIAICCPHVICFTRSMNGTPFYRGNNILLPKGKESLYKEVTTLPRRRLDVLYLKRVDDNEDVVRIRVRRSKIVAALTYLKANCPPYAHVNIDVSFMDSEEYDYDYDAVGMYLRKPANPDGCIPGNDTFVDMEAANAPVTEAELMQEAIRNTIPYPHVDGANLINERQDNEYFLTKCFPTLFPTGNGDYFQPFGVEDSHRKVDLKEYSSILLYHDFRFMKHVTFRYFVFNLQRRNFVHNFKNFVFSYTYDDITNNSNTQEFDILKLTVEQREEFLKNMKKATSDIPGTDGYLSKQLDELTSMVEAVGLPTLLITFSVADTQWTDVLSYIREVTGDKEAGQFDLVNTYVELTTAYLNRKFEAYLETLKIKWGIKDHWYRREFQMRGAVHFRCLIWLEDAPDVSKLNEGDDSEDQIQIRRQIIDYFDQYVAAVFPNVEDMPERLGDYLSHHRTENVENPEEDLRNQLVCYQIHRCSDAYCLRKKAGSSEKQCRFSYPQNLCEQSHIAFDEKGRPTFVPKRNHSNLNNYNGFITGTWCASHDLQAVLSTDALLMYLAKHVVKAEKQRSDYYNLFIHQLQSREENARNLNINRAAMSRYTFLKKLCMKEIADRDCSAFEVAIINSKKPLACMSRRIVTIDPIEGSLPIEQRRYVRNKSAIPALHKYMRRLEGVDDDEERRYRTGLSMYEMFQKYEVQYIPIQKRHLCEGRSFEWQKIENENEYKVVRLFPLIKADCTNELFCKREILSRTPFVELPTCESFVDEYAIRIDDFREFIDRSLPQRDKEDVFEDEPEVQANIIYNEYTVQVLQTHNLDEDGPWVIDGAQYEGPYTDSGVDGNPICAAIHNQGDALRFKSACR